MLCPIQPKYSLVPTWCVPSGWQRCNTVHTFGIDSVCKLYKPKAFALTGGCVTYDLGSGCTASKSVGRCWLQEGAWLVEHTRDKTRVAGSKLVLL